MATVLVVDDDPQVRAMLCTVLERETYDVAGAADGNEAMLACRDAPPDLVITDLVMPKMDGLELIRDLRDEMPQVRLIAISGGGRIAADSYLTLAEHMGVSRVFAKPVDRRELLEAVRELLCE